MEMAESSYHFKIGYYNKNIKIYNTNSILKHRINVSDYCLSLHLEKQYIKVINS